MSVINNMLKNIEQREAKQVSIQEGVSVKPIYDVRNIVFKAVILLIMLSVIFFSIPVFTYRRQKRDPT